MNNLLITGVMISDTTADGVNFHTGVTNSIVEHSILRNTGDDGLAMWAERTPNTKNTFRFNTVALPILANNIAIYGGSDNAILNNVVSDTITQGGGLHVGNRFGAVGIGGTTTIVGNEAIRCGCLDPNWQFGVGAAWFFALDGAMNGAIDFHDNLITDSPYEAIHFIGSGVSNINIHNITVRNVGSFVFQFQTNTAGAVSNVVASGVKFYGVYNCGVQANLQDKGGNTGWNTTHCGWPPALGLEDVLKNA
jgi:hypothetical protein